MVVDDNQTYPNPIDCGVTPDVTNLNALLQWKHDSINDIPSSSGQNADVYQVYENSVQRLYIKSAIAISDDLYSCPYTANDMALLCQSHLH